MAQRAPRSLCRLYGCVLPGAGFHAWAHVGAALRIDGRHRGGDVRGCCRGNDRRCCCQYRPVRENEDRPRLQAGRTAYGGWFAAAAVSGRGSGGARRCGHHVRVHSIRDVRMGVADRHGVKRGSPQRICIRYRKIGHERGFAHRNVRRIQLRFQLVHAVRRRVGAHRVPVHRYGERCISRHWRRAVP